MENDRSLARFAGQFVPLKIVTDGNPDWNKWARKYPIDGSGIPRLYVVRADGEKLFGAVGSLPGDKLPQMMLTTLGQAGRTFNDAEALLLEQSVKTAQEAIAREDHLAAASALSQMLKIGPPDELKSYARSALAAGELYQQLQTGIEAKVEKANEELLRSDNEQPMDAMLVLLESQAALRLFPKLKSEATAITREVKANQAYAEMLSQADLLVKARVLRASAQRKAQLRAPTAYASVIRRYPNTPVDKIARAELAEIDPDAKVLTAPIEPSETPTGFREWTARSGKFTTRAKYLQQRSGKVQLQKEDGKKIVVDISILSDEDQQFLRERS